MKSRRHEIKIHEIKATEKQGDRKLRRSRPILLNFMSPWFHVLRYSGEFWEQEYWWTQIFFVDIYPTEIVKSLERKSEIISLGIPLSLKRCKGNKSFLLIMIIMHFLRHYTSGTQRLVIIPSIGIVYSNTVQLQKLRFVNFVKGGGVLQNSWGEKDVQNLISWYIRFILIQILGNDLAKICK